VNLQNQLREKLFPPLETSSPERDAVVDHKSESQVMVMVFPYGSLNQTRICESTLEWLKEIGTEKNIRADDRNTPLSKALERIHKDGLPHFFLETSRLDFQVRSVDTYNHDIIEIGSNAPESMEFWLSVFARFKSHAPLIQAYLVERNYTRRQYYGKEDLKPGRRIFTKRTVIETVGGIMWFSDRFFKLTSASKTALHKIQDIEIEDDGEICAKGPQIMMGYYKDPEKTAEVMIDGYFHTGDIGEIDADGFLKITDRKKEMFKTSGGKYVAPQLLENRFKQSRFIEQLMVVGEGEKMPAALIQPDFEYLFQWAKENNITISENSDIVLNVKVIAKYQDEVNSANEAFAKWEKVKQFRLTPDIWSINEGHLTPTMKLRRKIIKEKSEKDSSINTKPTKNFKED
jgi:hypothetical protein